MKKICWRGCSQNSPFYSLGFCVSHCIFHRALNVFTQVEAEVFAVLRSVDSHLVEALDDSGRGVDAEGCCFPDVNVESAYC